MIDNKPLDSIDHFDFEKQIKANHKKTLIKIVVIIIFNTIMFVIFIKGLSYKDKLLTSLNTNLFGFNIIGFTIGTIVAMFPYKGLSYNKKYLRASLLTIFVLQAIVSVGLILIALMSLVGWY